MAHRASPDSRQDHGISQPVSLCPDSSGAKPSVAAGAIQHRISAAAPRLAANPRISYQPIHQCSQGELLKRKGHENVLDHGRVKWMGVTGPRTTDNVHVIVVKHAVDPGT